MKKTILLTCSLMVIFLAGCGPSSEVLAVTMVAQTEAAVTQTRAAMPTDTPTNTLMPTDTPFPTDTPIPIETPTSIPTATATYIPVPQQWNGHVSYSEGLGTQSISLLIEEIEGTAFSGKMIWHSFNNFRGATLKMNGEYITDFGDAVEQQKWNQHPDYKIGDRSGTWLKWTETEIIDGRNYTVNGWYYAHIREDRTMVAIYYFNADETVPDSEHFEFTLVQP